MGNFRLWLIWHILTSSLGWSESCSRAILFLSLFFFSLKAARSTKLGKEIYTAPSSFALEYIPITRAPLSLWIHKLCFSFFIHPVCDLLTVFAMTYNMFHGEVLQELSGNALFLHLPAILQMFPPCTTRELNRTSYLLGLANICSLQETFVFA